MPQNIPRCQALPLPDHQVSFQIDGRERLRWHFGEKYPRPFFYPLAGPSGSPLTRMGHPGDAGHDHHRSIWFAHQNVAEQDFWSDGTKNVIRQKRWLAYQDSDREAAMAVVISWRREDFELLEQELVAAVRDGGTTLHGQAGETLLELQTTFRSSPANKTDPILGKTNFGFLAVRVAKNLSAYFGGGQIRDSEGRAGEPAIFGKAAAWMDYSGPVPCGKTEGITYFDHPANPRYPAKWHVREDGWMGASVCRDGPRELRFSGEPLVLRYLLHAHAGALDAKRAAALAAEFSHSPAFQVQKSNVKHVGFQIARAKAG